MSAENKNLEEIEISLSDIDWNKLTVVEFQKVEKTLQEKQNFVKSQKEKQKRNSGFVFVKLRGKTYKIKEITYQRLKAMKSTKSKEKLIDEIVSESNPIIEL